MPGKNDVDFNAIYNSNNSGPFKFLDVFKNNNHTKAKIKFIETGTVLEVYLSHAFNGLVKDPYRPSVCGIAYLGKPINHTKKEYDTWIGMISRCYNINDTAYTYYGAKGVTVCKRWHYFEYFLEDLSYIPGYNLWIQYPNQYELDKDMLQMNLPEYLKVYSLETCCFIEKSYNSRYAARYQNQFDDRRISKYVGVTKDKGKPSFRSVAVINGRKYNFGSYETEEAAANMYNHITSYYYPNIDPKFLNNVSYMTMNEIQAQRRGAKQMCEIIHKENI